jgi:hypothetical protein
MYNSAWIYIIENLDGGGSKSGNNVAQQKGKFWFGQYCRINYQLGITYKRNNSMDRVGVHFVKNKPRQ